jgi:RNA polymerase sigma-70 factor (ECF subfamily)
MGDEEGDEIERVRQAASGDADAFTDLFNRYYPMIYAFAYRLCQDRSDAQEIAQETFIKAARAIASVRGSFKGWLYRIAHNTATDHLRARTRRSRLAEEMTVRADRESSGPPPDFSRVAKALDSLPAGLRAAVVLTFYEGMSHAGAARVLGCAETTVSWRIFMAKRQLGKMLSRDE